jgi:lysophospholipase L1-like esterase
VASSAPRFEPDIALIHLGTNDVRQGWSDSAISNGLGRIIDELRAGNPKVVILLAQIIPTRNSETTAKIRSLNKEIARLAGRRDSSKSPVVVVDQFTGFDPDAHTFDGVHPNDAGDERMASRWHEALLEFLP